MQELKDLLAYAESEVEYWRDKDSTNFAICLQFRIRIKNVINSFSKDRIDSGKVIVSGLIVGEQG